MKYMIVSRKLDIPGHRYFLPIFFFSSWLQ